MTVIIRGSSGYFSNNKGFPPANVTGIYSTSGASRVGLRWTDPDSIFVNEQDYEDYGWAGTLVLRKEGSYPESEKDGTVVIDSTQKNKYKNAYYFDNNLTVGTTYCYRFFPYSKKGLYNKDKNMVCVGVPMQFNLTLSDNSWYEIGSASESGWAASNWNIKDTIDITLSGTFNETITMEIGDFNHYDKTDGTGKAGTLFIAKNLMSIKEHMTSSTNEEGWEKSYMRNTVMNDIYNSLPEELKKVIKPVNIYSDSGYSSFTSKTTSDKVFIPSHKEVCDSGCNHSYVVDKSTNIPIFTTSDSSRIKNLNNGTGSAYTYWTRSSYARNYNYFWCVQSEGYMDYHIANYYGRVCFCFCV